MFKWFNDSNNLCVCVGCNVVISSRKLERLEAAAEELKKSIPTQSPATVTAVPCNIRNEDEVARPLHYKTYRYKQRD